MKVPRSPNNDWKWKIGRWMDEEGAIATITAVISIAVTLNKQKHLHRLHLDKLGFNFLSYTDMSRIYHKTMSAFKYFTHLLFGKHFSLGRTASYIVRRHIGLIFHYLKWHSIVRATSFFSSSFSLYYLFDDIKNIQLKWNMLLLRPEWSECVSFSTFASDTVTLFSFHWYCFVLCVFIMFLFLLSLCLSVCFVSLSLPFCSIFFSLLLLCSSSFFPSYIKWLDNVISLKFAVTQIKEIIEQMKNTKKNTYIFSPRFI